MTLPAAKACAKPKAAAAAKQPKKTTLSFGHSRAAVDRPTLPGAAGGGMTAKARQILNDEEMAHGIRDAEFAHRHAEKLQEEEDEDTMRLHGLRAWSDRTILQIADAKSPAIVDNDGDSSSDEAGGARQFRQRAAPPFRLENGGAAEDADATSTAIDHPTGGSDDDDDDDASVDLEMTIEIKKTIGSPDIALVCSPQASGDGNVSTRSLTANSQSQMTDQPGRSEAPAVLGRRRLRSGLRHRRSLRLASRLRLRK
jgi:hypothetical protein